MGIRNVSMCTTGAVSAGYSIVLGLAFLTDVIFTIVVCALFITKLRMVSKSVSSSSGYNQRQHRFIVKLAKLTRKYTILVLIACISSLSILGIGAIHLSLTLLMPIDVTINAFCVWLMFSFADNQKIFKKILQCCYCRCCGDQKEFIRNMVSLQSTSDLSKSPMTPSVKSDVETPVAYDNEITLDTDTKSFNVEVDSELKS